MDINLKKCSNASKPQSRKVEKESELIGSLSKQLYLAGNQIQRQQEVLKKVENRLKSKDQEINRLKRKIKEWEVKEKNQETILKKETQQQQMKNEKTDHVYRRCLQLEQKLLEMEKFLADYGLIWIGEKNRTKNNYEEYLNQHIDNHFDKLVTNIEELNSSIGKGEMYVCHNARGASFKTLPCIVIKFYKNGMIVQNGRLRPYNDPASKAFIKDILDGYFPSELQHQYPNGVSFKIEDFRKKIRLDEGTKYPGHGYQLGKLSSNDRISPVEYSTKAKRTSVPIKPSFDHKSYSSCMKRLDSSPPCDRKNSLSTVNKCLLAVSSNVSPFDLEPQDLRSQILASHNHNCSDTHLQSHLNAERALSARTEKITSAAKHVKYQSSSREGIFNYQDDVLKSESVNINRYNRSALNRSSLDVSYSHGNNTDRRPKSVSSAKSCFYPKQLPTIVPSVDSDFTSARSCKHSRNNKLRASKSATLDKQNNEIPIVQKVNEPTGESGELRLKIRSMSGSVVYLVYISTDDTVDRLYQLLNTVLMRKRPRVGAYKIVINGFVSRRLDVMEVPLKDYGINRDSVLHLVND
ncbi:uncharacterized protein [Chelonus insularis]|uniref:uncharacterized protein n=1 Tax=Chelonus insularis TaxID=460826 RepID=UPI00158E7BA1|nr:uncharacterized protein LOC118066243 [Chelonus insularis]